MSNKTKLHFGPESNVGGGVGVVVSEVRPASSSVTPDRLPTRMPLSIPRSQAYFWSHAWQEGEKAHLEERQAGHLRSFDTSDDLIRWLLTPED